MEAAGETWKGLQEMAVFYGSLNNCWGTGGQFLLYLLYACLFQNYTQDQLVERKAKMKVDAKSQQMAGHSGPGKLCMPHKRAERISINKSPSPSTGPEQRLKRAEQRMPTTFPYVRPVVR